MKNQRTILLTDNYKSVSGELQNSGQFQNNSVNGAISIIINRVIKYKICAIQVFQKSALLKMLVISVENYFWLQKSN